MKCMVMIARAAASTPSMNIVFQTQDGFRKSMIRETQNQILSLVVQEAAMNAISYVDTTCSRNAITEHIQIFGKISSEEVSHTLRFYRVK